MILFGVIAVFAFAGFGNLLIEKIRLATFDPSRGLPEEFHHELVAGDQTIFTSVLGFGNAHGIGTLVEHWVTKVSEWQPATSSGLEMKREELAVLGEFQHVIGIRDGLEQKLKVAGVDLHDAANILACSQQDAWRHMAAEERAKLIAMTKKVDLLASASLLR